MGRLQDETHARISASTINRMKQPPVDDIWIEELYGLTLSVMYAKNFPHKEEVVTLYNGLTAEQKLLSYAMEPTSHSFLPQL